MAGGRPPSYDDSRLLEMMAELLAWPERTQVRTQDQAMRMAIGQIRGSDRWTPYRVERIVARLKKAYPKIGPQLEAASRSRKTRVMFNGRAFEYCGPNFPPSLLSTARDDPGVSQTRSRASNLVNSLRDAAARTAWAADILEWQLRTSELPDPNLLSLGSRLVIETKGPLDDLITEYGKNSED